VPVECGDDREKRCAVAEPKQKAQSKAAESKASQSKAEGSKPEGGGRFKRAAPEPADVARTYFDAVTRRDLDGMATCWKSGGLDRIGPIGDLEAPDEVRTFFTGLFAAFPDWKFEVLDLLPAGDKVAVHWRAEGTFCGASFQGIEPTGSRIDLYGIDVLTVEKGLITRNDAYYDGAQFARQIGLLPPRDSKSEQRMAGAFNVRTRTARRLFGLRKERVADGVWVLRGGFPAKTMNVYLIEDGDGVTMFDGGIEAMSRAIAAEVASMGSLTRIVLGHSHGDHRGAVPGLRRQVLCHPDEVADAVSDGGEHYFDYSKLERRLARLVMPRLVQRWDGGPVQVEGTLEEGTRVGDFEVVHLPGHAPGLIGLWRASDKLALCSDALYTIDPQTGFHGPPRVPHRAFNHDTEQARESIRKLAAMEPAAVWPGHADPVTGDVRQQLERAANTT
jgi:glyoxylase-like metal-dependent hydrolase (beta-lactamase superfamily II)/predicted ester cyclase